MVPIESDLNPDKAPAVKRAWLASLLLQSQQTWFGRFALQLRRLAGLRRGQRQRLQRKAAVSLAGAALVLSLGAGLLQPDTVHAATITVGSGVVAIADDGDCSLPEAILNANNDNQVYASAGECAAGAAGSDTINLPNNSLFLLTAAYGYSYYSDNGLPEIDSAIIIEGNGSEIRRDGNATPFRILAVTTSGDLTLNNTTISYGYAYEDGGGLYVAGAALIQGSTFEYNYAFDDGGGIEVDVGGSLIIDNSVIGPNDAGQLGGGVSAEDGATLTIRNGTSVSDNYANSGGGGVYANSSGLVTIDSSTISDNTAGYFGGGIATYETEIVIQGNTTISGNSAFVYGGGADFYLSDVTITASTISGNEVYFQGGGLHLDGSTVTIERSTIDDNHTAVNDVAPFMGGGIFNGPVFPDDECEEECDIVYGDLTIIESTISGNSSFLGGGIGNYAYSRVAVYKSTLTDNEATYGGGLLNFYGTWAVVNSTVSGNRAVKYDNRGGAGGGILNLSISQDAEPLYWGLILSTVTGNEAASIGGGIANFEGPMFIAGSIVSGNTSVDGGNEIWNDETQAAVYFIDNLLGHSGETTPQALAGIIPDTTDIVATSDGSLPTALAAILETTLANNGGPTQTHALVANSPAVDYITDSACSPTTPFGDLTDDQRSEPRNIDIPGMGNDGNNEVCDIGAYELQLPASGAFCPVDVAGVGYPRTDAIGTGQGSPTKGAKTRKLVIPNADDLASLYGQLAAVDVGVMKYVRFLPQGYPKIQIQAPTSPAYRTHAVDWWGSELPTDVNWVKGQFFWGAKGNKAPRAFVLWPTYETDEAYANAFVTFDESAENHVAWEAGFIPNQTQTVAIPEVQEDGATVNVTVALVDVNRDNRSIILTVEAGNVSEERIVTAPNRGDLLNLEEFALENVDAGTDEVVITLESPVPGGDFPAGGDSAAMIGAVVNYVCGEEPDQPQPIAPQSGPQQSSFWTTLATRFAQPREQLAPANRSESGGRFWSQFSPFHEDGHAHRANRNGDR